MGDCHGREDYTISITPAPHEPFPLICIVGPTAAGKSDLALFLAEALGGEVVNGDSLQVYRGMEIGTAKPAPAERARVPHHLFDIRDPGKVFTAGDYAREARVVLREIGERCSLPIVCGGAGFYLRALLDGLADAPPRDEPLRVALEAAEARRAGVLHRYLRRLDAAAAERIHARDRNKLVRAIEVCQRARKPLTAVHAQRRPAIEGYRVLKLGLDPPRAQLYARIEERVDRMFGGGLLDEVRGLVGQGYTSESKALESVGYKQCLAYLAGTMTLGAAVADTKQRTRNYAKRQLTWFRREAEIVWLSGCGTERTVRESALVAAQNFVTQA